MVYERVLYSTGLRGAMIDPKTEKPRISDSTLSFDKFLYSLTVPFTSNFPNTEKQQQPQSITSVILPQCTLHNAGNDAFMCLFALQKLLEPAETLVPTIKKSRSPNPGIANSLMINNSGAIAAAMKMSNSGAPSPNMNYSGFAFATLASIPMRRQTSAYDLSSEFGQMHVGMPRATSGGGGVYPTSPVHTRDKISKKADDNQLSG